MPPIKYLPWEIIVSFRRDKASVGHMLPSPLGDAFIRGRLFPSILITNDEINEEISSCNKILVVIPTYIYTWYHKLCTTPMELHT